MNRIKKERKMINDWVALIIGLALLAVAEVVYRITDVAAIALVFQILGIIGIIVGFVHVKNK